MSKTSKSRLTGSRKKRVRSSGPRRQRQPKPTPDRLDALDAIEERCTRIETLTGLLRACEEPEEMNVRLAARAGACIADDLRQVRQLVAALGKGTP